jgi:MFS family permease
MLSAYREIFHLPRPVWMLFCAGVINRMGNMVLPFLALYSNQVLGLSAAEASLIVTVYGVGALVSGFLSGWLCDRLGAIYILIGCLLTAAVLQVSLSFIHQPGLFAVVVFFLALCGESFRPSLLSLGSQYGPPDKQRQTFALIRLSANLGMSVGPVVGGVIFVYSPILLFWINGAFAAMAGFAMWISLYRGIFLSRAAEPATDRLSLWKSLSVAYSDRRLVWMLLAGIPGMIVLFQHESALPLMLVRDLGMTEADYGMIFTVNTLMIILFEIGLTAKLVPYSPGKVMALGSMLMGLGFSLIPFVTNRWMLQLTTVVWTAGEMLVFPLALTYVSSISTPRTRGSFMSAYGVMISSSIIVSPPLGTGIWQVWGLSGFSVFCLVCGAVGACMLWRAR